MTDWRRARTERLWLDVSTDDDVDDLFAIHADPVGWRHLPSGRHTDRAVTEERVRHGRQDFAEHGLGYWSVRDAEGGPVIGRAGCCVARTATGVELPWWHLYYRFASAVHGRGYAVEASRRALDAVAELDPERAVLASLLEHNTASRRTAERLGLRSVWRGPDRDNPDPAAIRLVLLDREPTPEVERALEEEFDGPGAS